jgi:hypothetical protein
MTPEQKLWSRLSKHLHGYWDATRHEDAVTSGTPDVSWGSRNVNGWLELKVIKQLPHKNVVVKVDLRPAQRVFLLNRMKAGGHCSVLVQVEKTGDCFLFDKPEQIKTLGKTMKVGEFCGTASIVTMGCLPEPERFIDILTGIRRYGEL